VAVTEFNLSDEQRKRVVVQEWGLLIHWSPPGTGPMPSAPARGIEVAKRA
jgi:hypothetical protein